MRPLQCHFIAYVVSAVPDLNVLIPLPPELHPFLEWWMHTDRFVAGNPFQIDAPQATIASDDHIRRIVVELLSDLGR